MMKIKKSMKSFIALLCSLSLVLSCVGIMSTTTSANTGAVLTPINIENFGKEDGATLGKATYTGESLLNTVFTGKVRATTSGTNMYYGGSGKWYGIKFNFTDQKLQINNQNISGDNSGTFGAYDFTPTQLGATSFLNEDLKFKITIQAITGNTTDVQVIIEINDNECLTFTAVKALPAVTSGRGLGKVIETESGNVTISKATAPLPTLTDITIENFGKEDGATLGKATYTGESLLNTIFTGKVRATTSGTNMYYGGSGKWYGIKFNFQDQKLQINNQNIFGENSGTFGAYDFTPSQLDANSFLNEDLEFKITIQEIAGNTTDVQVVIEINDNECLNFTAVKALPAVTSGRGLGKVIETESGNVTISKIAGSSTPPVNPPTIKEPDNLPNVKEIKIADFNMSRGEVAGVGKYSQDTILNTSFSTKLKFTSLNTFLVYGGKSNWSGLQFILNANGTITINANALAEPGISDLVYPGITSQAIGLGTDGFLNKEIDLTIKVTEYDIDKDGESTDVYIGIYFGGNLYQNIFVKGSLLETNGASRGLGNVLACPQGAAELDPLPEKVATEPSLDEVDFIDLHVESGLYTFNANKLALSRNYKKGFVNKTFVGTVNFSDKAGSYITLAGRQNAWEGIQIRVLKDGKLFLSEANNRFGAMELDPAKANTDTFNNKDITVKLSFEQVDLDDDGMLDDIRLWLYFDDVLYNGKPIKQLVDYAQYIGTYFGIYSSNEKAYVKVTAPIREVDFSIMGFSKDWKKTLGLDGRMNLSNEFAPQTGDNYSAGAYLIVLCVSLGAILIINRIHAKQQKSIE